MKFQIIFMGSLGVIPLYLNRTEYDEKIVIDWARNNLPNYWPTYYNVAVYDVTDKEQSCLIANFVSKVTVEDRMVKEKSDG